jgi:GNAT-family acetyltransferase (TIGR03103 family)
MTHIDESRERLERLTSFSLKNWQNTSRHQVNRLKKNICVDMGWGRIIFGHTFQDIDELYGTICQEDADRRDIALYIRDPHVLLSKWPDKLFLDPSHTYRLWAHDYRIQKDRYPTLNVRRVSALEDAEAINRIYQSRQMVKCNPRFMLDRNTSKLRTYLVAEDMDTHSVVGTVTGLDHAEAFDDPEGGTSLWCLAVDPQAKIPGIGEALVRHLVEHYLARGRSYIDLSVMHDNKEAISLYEKLGFKRVPVFCIKRKNQINEPLYVSSLPEENLNPYARIITREARRRGISVEVVDPEFGYFNLVFGGRSITCRESLTEMTSAIAMSRCDDKRLTNRVLQSGGLKVPKQYEAAEEEADNGNYLKELKRVVVKPARGEQGDGVSVDIQSINRLGKAIEQARNFCPDVIIEELCEGQDLRVIVIDYQMVAAAVRRPPKLIGTGRHTILDLIEKYNRRRAKATDGESRIPIDDETERCILNVGYNLDDVIQPDETLQVRKTANLHTGGTIHDVTNSIHSHLIKVSEKAARALDIPVTGLDLIVPDLDGSEYRIIEANERPGLANHEPQPTAERFVDYLFPQTISND